MKLYILIGRIIRPMLVIGFLIYNSVFHTPRARVVVINERDEMLLVKDWSGTADWSLPGGGVHRHEAAIKAASRELYEETGIAIAVNKLEYLTTVQGRNYPSPIYTAFVDRDLLPDRPHNRREIIEIAWFSVKKLPELSKISRRAVRFLEDNHQI